MTLVSNDARTASRERSASRPRARDHAVDTTWSMLPNRSPSAAIDASSVMSTSSVLTRLSPAYASASVSG